MARIAGIQAAKRTAELVPMCHPLHVEHVEVDVEPDPSSDVVDFIISADGSALQTRISWDGSTIKPITIHAYEVEHDGPRRK